MLPPSSRKGALGDQKGPRIEEEVGSAPSVNILWAISSTRLETVRFRLPVSSELALLTIRDQ